MGRMGVVACALTLAIASPMAQDRSASAALEKQARELEEAKRQLREKQVEILRAQIEALKQGSPGSPTIGAMQAILDLKLSQVRVRAALTGARIVAADGTYLGTVGPTYDTDSIFCSYGPFGATYSPTSIWCTYGQYGASYNVLSPFCPYSRKPPRIMINGIAVASLTVSAIAFPVAISPNALKAIFAEE